MRLLLVTMTLLACASDPNYPFCETREQCKSGEHCAKGKCVACVDTGDCGNFEVCRSGRCVAQTCESPAECDTRACIKGQCGVCSTNDHCGDLYCHKGKCVAAKPCSLDEDCPDDEDCVAGMCSQPWAAKPPPNVDCQLPTVYFALDQSELNATARTQLEDAAKCINKVRARSVVIEGHTDISGTIEYNLALSLRRAKVAQQFLIRLGVRETRLKMVPMGESRPTQRGEDRDRRAILIWN